MVFQSLELPARDHRRLPISPAELKVHDVTLRDGEQQAGVELDADEKLRIAEALSEAGIHRIEAGLPAVSPADEEAVRRIAAAGFDSEIYAFRRCMVSDVELAIDCGVAGVVMEIPSSHHLIEKAYRWPIERALEASIETTKLAHDARAQSLLLPDRRHPGGDGRTALRPRDGGA